MADNAKKLGGGEGVHMENNEFIGDNFIVDDFCVAMNRYELFSHYDGFPVD